MQAVSMGMATALRTAMIFLAVVLSGCPDNPEHWEGFEAKGLWKELEDRVALEFMDRNVGLLGATRMTEGYFDTKLGIGDAVIYRTEDGGKSWSVSLEIAGGFRGLCCGAGRAYALTDVRKHDYQEPLSEIWTSRDRGKSWAKTYATEWPWHIMKLVADDTDGFAAIFRGLNPDGGRALPEWVMKSGDGGLTWTRVAELTHVPNYETVVLHHGKLFLFVHSNGTFLSQLDLQSGVSSVLKPLGRFRAAVMAADREGGIRIVDQPESRGQLRLVTLSEDGEFATQRALTDIERDIPMSLHVAGESMFLITGGHASILGVTHHFYHSDDQGRSWTEEKLPFSLIVEPAAYLGRNYAWLDAGGGRLQRRGFTSE
jgi:hypothetical protein